MPKVKARNLKKGEGQPEFIEFNSTDSAIRTAVYEYNNNCRTFELEGYKLDIDKATGKATGAKKKSKDDEKET